MDSKKKRKEKKEKEIKEKTKKIPGLNQKNEEIVKDQDASYSCGNLYTVQVLLKKLKVTKILFYCRYKA